MAGLDCSICLEPFHSDRRRPLVGTCGHSFCHVCVEKLDSNRCPECRKDRSFLDAPTNFGMLRQMETIDNSKNDSATSSSLSKKLKNFFGVFRSNKKSKVTQTPACDVITEADVVVVVPVTADQDENQAELYESFQPQATDNVFTTFQQQERSDLGSCSTSEWLPFVQTYFPDIEPSAPPEDVPTLSLSVSTTSLDDPDYFPFVAVTDICHAMINGVDNTPWTLKTTYTLEDFEQEMMNYVTLESDYEGAIPEERPLVFINGQFRWSHGMAARRDCMILRQDNSVISIEAFLRSSSIIIKPEKPKSAKLFMYARCLHRYLSEVNKTEADDKVYSDFLHEIYDTLEET